MAGRNNTRIGGGAATEHATYTMNHAPSIYDIAAANCATFDAVFAAHVHPEIGDAHRKIIHATLGVPTIDERTVAMILDLLVKGAAPTEPPMSVAEAVKLTGLTAQGLNYHARRGRIRRAYVPGSSRSLGYVAADIRAIVEGRAAR